MARQQKLFSYFDVNRDGVSDFVAIAPRAWLASPRGRAALAEEVLHAARLRFSWLRKADSDADRRVTADEWRAHCAKEFSGEGLSGEAEAFARAFFRTLDVDQDAAIDFGDYAHAHLAYGRNPTVEAPLPGLSRARRERERQGHDARVSLGLRALRGERRRRCVRPPRQLGPKSPHARCVGSYSR